MTRKRRATTVNFFGRLKRLLVNRSGNVAVLAALMMPPVILAMSAGLDYIQAAGREERLNGIADAAALAAVTPEMMTNAGGNQSMANASATACALFKSQAAQVGNINNAGFTCNTVNATNDPTINNTTNPSIVVADNSNGNNILRTVTVKYNSASSNVFVGVLGFPTIAISGLSVSKSSLSPQINFYLLVDTSPSMEIAATTAGIAKMVSLTPQQQGCAFACHETNPAGDDAGNPPGEDNFALSRANCVTLRTDLVNDAVNNLMQVAPATATANNTTYGLAIYTMDVAFNNLLPLTTNWSQFNASGTTTDGGCTQTSIPNYLTINPLAMYSQEHLVAGDSNNDADTLSDSALQQMYQTMPLPGNGSGAKNDSPKEVLFIISDGVTDYYVNGNRYFGPINSNGNNWCQSIKNNGIRIAFLYLTYNPLPTNSFYNANIAQIQSQIGPAAQACASPGLYFQVNTDGDITAALAALFQKAVATAYLAQ